MKTFRLAPPVCRAASTALLLAIGIIAIPSAKANHPVLVEGNNVANGVAGTTNVIPRAAGDYDGDGLVGLAEDIDNQTDFIFGTINGALGSLNGGVNQNGRVTIVTTGRFNEQILITASNGNVTIEAASGVEANIDAVVPGANGGGTRQNAAGIVIDAPSDRVVTLRNLVVRDFAVGILIRGKSRVVIDNCRIENNRDHGIKVVDEAKVTITNTHVNGTGYRVGSLGDSTKDSDAADPGNGITFEDDSTGYIALTVITGSLNIGISGEPSHIIRRDVVLFDNETNRSPK